MSSELFTVCFWSGYEGNRSTFRPWVKRRAAVLSVISSKKANIIIETNKVISWFKSSINDGLNKQSNLLGKIKPKCTLLPSPDRFVLNPVFSRVCRVCSLLCCAKLKTAESCILFFCLILQKSKDNFFIECTQIKADLLQFRLSSWPRRVASTVGRGNKSSDCFSTACAHS